MGIPDPAVGDSFRCQVKIRYRHPGQCAAVEKTGDDEVKITFEEPVRSATPGQSAVFYDENDCLLGGGIISEAVFS
jgi:tRNA-specific 2-thiouridylase